MFNRNTVIQNQQLSAYFDQISQIQIKHVNVDFDVNKLFSQYQIPCKKPKNKQTDSGKRNAELKKISESSISTKQRSKNQEDSGNIVSKGQNKTKDNNVQSLKKNISKKVLYIQKDEKQERMQHENKKTARKKTVYSQFERGEDKFNKQIKSPEIKKLDRKVSKTKEVHSFVKNPIELKKAFVKPMQQNCNSIKKSRQSSVSNKNENLIRKSRSDSNVSLSRKRIGSKAIIQTKVEKIKEENKKIIMRDYFGQDELQNHGKKSSNMAQNQAKTKRSSSKSNNDIGTLRQTTSRQRLSSKSRQRMGSTSRQRKGLFFQKNRFEGRNY